ncbi:MAG: tetratricopeptide repeat protein [Chloroflexi bacterium]|nr:tetratricopeptide repeat protein [Chloroflexota bacterium]
MEKPRDSYAVLGVPKTASLEEIEKRYAELQKLFASSAVPPDLADWAASQREQIRLAYVELTGQSVEAAEDADVETYEEPQGRSFLHAIFDRPLAMAAVGVVAGVIILGGYLGVRALTGEGAPAASPAATPQAPAVDTARVKELEALVRKDPKNEQARQELGDLYFQAERWDEAARWYGRVLEVNPNNVNATIDLGTSQFYLDRPDMAKLLWKRATELDPKNVEAHFNLGILYSVVEPRDLEAAQREWELVIELDPASELADIVRSHQQPPAAPEPTPEATPTPTTTAP